MSPWMHIFLWHFFIVETRRLLREVFQLKEEQHLQHFPRRVSKSCPLAAQSLVAKPGYQFWQMLGHMSNPFLLSWAVMPFLLSVSCCSLSLLTRYPSMPLYVTNDTFSFPRSVSPPGYFRSVYCTNYFFPSFEGLRLGRVKRWNLETASVTDERTQSFTASVLEASLRAYSKLRCEFT